MGGELLLVTETGLLHDARHWPTYMAVTMAMAAPLPMEAVVDTWCLASVLARTAAVRCRGAGLGMKHPSKDGGWRQERRKSAMGGEEEGSDVERFQWSPL